MLFVCEKQKQCIIYGICGLNAGIFFFSGSVFKMVCSMRSSSMHAFKAGGKKQTFQTLFRKDLGAQCVSLHLSL